MHNGGATVTRAAALPAFARFENQHQHAAPGLRYPELLTRVHRSIAESLGLETNAELDAAFGASVPHWPAIPGPRPRRRSAEATALRSLKRHYALVRLLGARQSPRPFLRHALLSNRGPFPPPALPGFPSTTGLSATLRGPT